MVVRGAFPSCGGQNREEMPEKFRELSPYLRKGSCLNYQGDTHGVSTSQGPRCAPSWPMQLSSCCMAWSTYSYHRRGDRPGHKTEHSLQLGQKKFYRQTCNSPTLYTSNYLLCKLFVLLYGVLAVCWKTAEVWVDDLCSSFLVAGEKLFARPLWG